MVSLTKQSLLIRSSNGIKDSVFKDLMGKGPNEIMDPLTRWGTSDDQFAMPMLWDAIDKIGKVSHLRTVRQVSAGNARAIGLAGR